MFPIDAFTKIKPTDSNGLIIFRAFVSILLTIALLVNLGLQIYNIATGGTFFQVTEVGASGTKVDKKNNPYINYWPNMYIYYEGNKTLKVIPYQHGISTPPNGTIYIQCTMDFAPACPGFEVADDGRYISFPSPSNVVMAENSFITILALFPANYESTDIFEYNFWDSNFDPFNKTMNSVDLDFYLTNSYIEGISEYNNVFLAGGFNFSYNVQLHRIITKRNLLDRSFWETFCNYIGLEPNDEAVVINIPNSFEGNTGDKGYNATYMLAGFTIDQPTITVQSEIRIHTVSTVFSNLGGIYSFLILIYIFFFGKLPESPWGFYQQVSVYFKRKATKKTLYDKINETFNTSSGIPLAREAKWPKRNDTDSRVNDLQERQESLEKILNEFFLGTSFLQDLQHHARRENDAEIGEATDINEASKV